ncbi:Ger(x)C family spore germination protein [Viridibacillus sp. FSL R5-0477]|uniref:Ger(X)C family germination protein n=1 Tax=Viridibacillus arenosi FSL R5-213 TaxID=1227360 RepID=W4F2J8_9BACL|nr:Ger(x)C family spore germination protein [Viridibacillus arenosi]ETT86714.1 Ger(x)C family germination protein [Viridibacillus arenosi FSL R5-213]OMC89516.1 spore gernimation protein GerC [Viridibacillus arenosi]
MKKCMFVLLILSLFLTGCWDRRELNELGITLAIGIDKVEDEYQVTAQVVVPSEISAKTSTGRSPVTLFQANGETVYEALRKITKNSPRKIYPGHLRTLVLGEDLAEEGIAESLDFLSRDWELRSDFFVVIAKDMTAGEVLNVTTTIENIPANHMFNTLKTSEAFWAATNGFLLDELIANLTIDGKEAVLTGILVTGEKMGSSKQNVESITPSAQIKYDELAVFKKDKLVGWLTERQSRGYNGIVNEVQKTVTAISCPEKGKATLEIIQFDSKIKGKINKGKPEVDVNIKVKGNVGEVECQINLNDQETIVRLEKNTENKLEEIYNMTIETVQKQFKSDIFGFGEAIHRSNPKEWKKIKKQWDEEFPEMTANVKVDVKIVHTGTEGNSFLDEIEVK